MNACRQNLAAAIATLADQVEILDQSLRPVQRLGELTTDLEQLDREIAAREAPWRLKSSSQVTLRWRGVDSNFWFRCVRRSWRVPAGERPAPVGW